MHTLRHTILLALTGALLSCDAPTAPVPEIVEPPLEAGFWRALDLGHSHSCGIAEDGLTYCWGDASIRLLGDGGGGDSTCTYNGFTRACRAEPRAIAASAHFTRLDAGPSSTCGTTTAGELWCWGANGAVQTDSIYGYGPKPVQGIAPTGYVMLGQGFACGLFATDARCWGTNSAGQHGDGTLDPLSAAPVSLPAKPTVIVTGSVHACALVDRKAWCWGNNSAGQLGIGTIDDDPHPTPVAVSQGSAEFVKLHAGGMQTCALDAGGAAHCWGSSSAYHPQFSAAPALVANAPAFVSLAVAEFAACGLATDGRAHCWGLFGATAGQADLNAAVPTPQPVAGDHQFTRLSMGDRHACGIDTTGEMWCWGWAHVGQLSEGNVPEGCFASDEIYRCTGVPQLVRRPGTP